MSNGEKWAHEIEKYSHLIDINLFENTYINIPRL